MKFKTLTGKIRDVSISKYRINWENDFPSNFAGEVADFLYEFWKNDVVLVEFPLAGTRMRYDMVNLTKRIIVEQDGRQHDSFVPYFHGNRLNYLAQIRRDLGKDKFAELNGFKMVRIKPSDLPLTAKFFYEKYDIIL